MKTQFTNRHALAATSGFVALLAAGLSLLSPVTGSAQVFNPATGTEYTFPGPGPVNVTTHSFTYTMGHVAYMAPGPCSAPPFPPSMPAPPPPMSGPLTDLTVHSWDDPGSTSGIAYLSTANGSGTPGTVYDQGVIMYPQGVQDIEMSLMQDEMGYNMFPFGSNGPWYVVVSYYNPGAIGGPGHFYDVYLWNPPATCSTGGLTLVSTTRLSHIGHFTRISQDGHNTYAFCITWEDPANGIDYIQGFMDPGTPGVSTSPVYTLPGTLGETHPDVAFTHTSSGLNLQFIYYMLVGGQPNITEATVPMILGSWPIPSPASVINDVNVVPFVYAGTPDLQTRLDAPDHGAPDNWAYSYIMPAPAPIPMSNDIFVRFNNGGVYTTYDLTNGSMGPLSIDHFANNRPVVSFDNNTSLLNVSWYTQFRPGGFFAPNVGGYVGLQMTQAGAVLSPLDYLQVGEAASASNTLASNTPTIANSRQNDRTDYEYVVFANQDPSGAGNEMQVKDRPWANPTFKGGHFVVPGAEFYNQATAVASTPTADNKATAYPNPFSAKVALAVSADLAGKALTAIVEDISGRVLGSYSGDVNAINSSLAALSPTLASGTYILKVQSKANNFNQVLKIEKTAE